MSKTGPKTKEGKAVASKNATTHGILSNAPVIAGVESDEDWQHHLAGIVDSYQPANHHEQVLAERIALLLWRLQRTARYEHETILNHRSQYVGELADALEKARVDSYGRHARILRILDSFSDDDAKARYRSTFIPPDYTLDTIMRYEAHVHRQYIQTKHELEAMQAIRRGREAPLARLDVTVNDDAKP